MNEDVGKDSKVSDLKNKLEKNYNIILRGAPGTGKTYLARQIAAAMIGISVDELDSSEQFGFVQFHSSYDYTDFVEGLRPVFEDNQIGFELKKGIFYEFCEKAKISETFDLTLDGFDKFLEEKINEGKINRDTKNKYFVATEQLLGKKSFKAQIMKNLIHILIFIKLFIMKKKLLIFKILQNLIILPLL